MALPQIPQTSYGAVPQALGAGETWAKHPNRYVPSAFVPAAGLTLTSQVTDGTMSTINGTADVGLYIDGALYNVTTPASNAALVAGLNAIVGFSNIAVASNPSGSTLRVTFRDYDDHTVTAYSPGAPDITGLAASTAASDPDYVRPGMGVVLDTATSTSSGDQFAVKLPTSAAEAVKCVGVVGTETANAPADYAAHGYESDAGIPPGFTFALKRRDFVKLLLPTSESVSKGDAAYLIYSGADAGKWRNDDGGSASQVTRGDVVAGYVAGVAQVTRGDVVFNGVEAVGLDVDSLPTLSVASDTDDDTTATALRDAWNASAQHAAVAAATIDLSGAESYIILSFLDGGAATHTVTAYSPATADVTGITNTTARVAPVADAVSVTVDSLGAISITPTSTNDDTNATALAAAWNASPAHYATAVASTDFSGAESYFILTFAGTATHTVTDSSAGVAAISGLADTTSAVAPTAAAVPGVTFVRTSSAGYAAYAEVAVA